MTMKPEGLSYSARKALMVHIGEAAGGEIADVIARLVAEVEELRQTKVSVTRITPPTSEEAREYIEEPV